ncbi:MULTISPECIES: AfsR/SARP family transcriptional regulator [Streptomyces]|uniref:SARP family transcriptional regulator n=1 Tax=Streptomyces griseus TaxID=1911 RepID=A0A380N925_STRGR|nr:AfsR/SARP family transcriptional regulator [Streptomyces griseus]SUP27306.1 SARP family transcriptional regulator [Streptomyces griseus]
MSDPRWRNVQPAIQLLGNVQVNGSWRGQLTLSSRKVLAVLTSAGAEIGMNAYNIADHLWGSTQPASGLQMVRSYVMTLRMALRSTPVQIVHNRATGYRLILSSNDVDAYLFEACLRNAQKSFRSEKNPQEAIRSLEAGLGMWRSETAMPEVQDVILLKGEAQRLQELRLQAEETLAEVRLRAYPRGHHSLIPRLLHLVHLYPFRERLIASLMIALYSSGRRVEALLTYSDSRLRFIEYAGVEPAITLRRIQVAILNSLDHDSLVSLLPEPSSGCTVPPSQVPGLSELGQSIRG